MAWLHRSLKFFWKLVNIGEGTLNTITVILPNNFELPFFRCFDLQMLRIGGLLIFGCPKWIVSNWCSYLLFRLFGLQTLRIRGLLMVGFPKWIVSDWCSYFVMILNFCIDRPFPVSNYQDNFYFFFVSNFCLDYPFGFSVHRDAHFCLSRFLGFATYWTFLTEYFLTASASIGRASFPPSIVVKVIAHEPS